MLLAAVTAVPQGTAPPQFKGIWEPVNYTEDLKLTDIFCVSADVCYVAGAAGTILKTTDGGQSWTQQLGGDPRAPEPAIGGLQFLSETHGWALQAAGAMNYMLLRTTDGDTWEKMGEIGNWSDFDDYAFLSETDGVYLTVASQGAPPVILQTRDAGRTWKQVFACQAKVQAEGLTRDVACYLQGMHFPSPSVGYAVGGVRGIKDQIFIAKTEDGGTNWNLRVVPGPTVWDMFAAGDIEVFFIDESTGFIRPDRGTVSLYVTTDGGETWRGLAASGGSVIKFADPEVGWSFIVDMGNQNGMLTYTLDGGKRWSSRQIRFPAAVHAFSLPRRDRGYVVGDHGMIYRYRVVPATEGVAANTIVAPAMPVFDSPLDEQVEELASEVQELEASVTEAAEAAGVQAPAESAEAAPEEGEGEETQEESTEITGWAKDCCGSKLQKLQTILEAVSTQVPKFSGKYRNLNLAFSGLQVVGQMFGQAQSLKDSFKQLRRSKDPQAAMQLVGELTSMVQNFRQTTRQAFQKPPEE